MIQRLRKQLETGCIGLAIGIVFLAPSIQADWVSKFEPEIVTTQTHWMGAIEEPRLNESSGLAASQQNHDLLWSINDSGGEAELFALTTRGEHLGVWQLDLPKPTDWEAMASFSWQGRHYLLIADIGDNFAMRDTVSFTIVEEPDMADILRREPLVPLVTQQFRYPRGPRDSEAVAVDSVRGDILFLTKRTEPPELYRLPLTLEKQSSLTEAVVTAEFKGALRGFSKPSKTFSDFYGSALSYMAMPTGMSLSGDSLLVTTMGDALLFDRDSLSRLPKRLPLPYVGQREAITFASDHPNTAYVSQERPGGLRMAHIYRLQFDPSATFKNE